MTLAGIRIINEEEVSDPVFKVRAGQMLDHIRAFEQSPSVYGDFGIDHFLEGMREMVFSLFALKESEQKALLFLYEEMASSIEMQKNKIMDDPEKIPICMELMQKYKMQISSLFQP